MTLEQLRARAVAWTFGRPTTLKAAIFRLGFVQADPIRAPARAQDLILRPRVSEYRAGDLERDYASLDIEEDLLYAYGFLPRPVWQLLHPRKLGPASALERRVLERVRQKGATHPSELAAHFGSRRVVNAWGGYSKATKHALERLHDRGLLRIARRERGVRVYEPAPPPRAPLAAAERLRELTRVVAHVLAPVQRRTLQAIASRLARRLPGATGEPIAALLRLGALEPHLVDGVAYLSPPARTPAIAARVRIVAPFDPLVWDRRRFAHLWNWEYRFEAYTPIEKRVRGYYAMPLVWGDRVVGWATAEPQALRFEYVAGRPRDRGFSAELEAEVERFRHFLG